MSITRINHFQAKAGMEEKSFDFLRSVVSAVQSAPGCISCRLLRSADNAANLAIVEEWESIAAHQKAAKAIPAEKLKQAMALFAKPPAGAYYEG